MRVGRLPAPTGDPRADAIAQLRWSMAGEGLTADKLRYMPAVLGLPAVRDALAGVPAEHRLATACQLIAETARRLGGSEPFAILRAALGIDYVGRARNLTDRRRQFQHVGDARTIRDIERRMVQALVTELGGVSEDLVTLPSQDGERSEPLVWNVPVLHDPHFLGRDELMTAILQELQAGGTTALTYTVTQTVSGLGGIGKTALAAEFAYRHVADYDVVWWLRAEEPGALASDFAALAVALDLRVPGGQTEAIAAVRAWLTGHGRWLLVFDNAQRPEDVEPYLPGLRGHVLVTSRNPHWSTIAKVIDVPPLRIEVAAELLRRRTGLDDPAGAELLAAKLHGIPKVLEVAAGMFTRGSAVSLTRFATGLGDGTTATEGVWDAAFDRVLAVAGAREILAACVVVNPDDIQVELLGPGLDLAEHTAESAIGALRTQQILHRRVDGLTIHRLLQAAARDRLGPDEQRAAAHRIAELLCDLELEPSPDRHPFVRRAQAHAPYLAAVLGDDPRTGALLAWYAIRLVTDGAYRLAHDVALRALAVTEAVRDPDHPEIGRRLGLLAWVLREHGDLAAAREIAERALAATETALGPEHPEVGSRLCGLAGILRGLGELTLARQAAERGLRVADPSRGVQLGTLLHTLATTLQELGRPQEAWHTAERGLAVTEAALGPEHSDVGAAHALRAWILIDLGDLPAARVAAEHALAVTEAAMGSEHADVGRRARVLAAVQHRSGELAQARSVAERAVAVTEAALGPHHPDVALGLGTLAAILRDSGELAAARQLAERASAVNAAALGSGHPETERSRRLATTIRGEGAD